MKKFIGKSNGIITPLIVRIGELDTYNSTIPFYESYENNISGYIAFSNKKINTDYKTLFIDKDIFLNNGDIILINPNGSFIVLYDSSVDDNTLFITSNCNLNCKMCPQPKSNNDDINSIEIVFKIIELLRIPPQHLGITGGEPTCCWNKLIELLNIIKIKFPETSIQLLTNGIKFRNISYVKELVDSSNDITVCIPIYSCIDSIHDSIVRKSGAFWETIEGLYNLEIMNIYIELRIVIMNENIDNLYSWSNFIYRFLPFVGHVSFMGMEPFHKAIYVKKIYDFTSDSNLLESVKFLHRTGMKVAIFNISLCLLPEYLRNFSVKSISSWKRRYFNICKECKLYEECGGFFESWLNIDSFSVKPKLL